MTGKEKSRILVIPERNGESFNACGWIRLVDPFTEIALDDDFEIRFGTFNDVERWVPNVVVSQRCAMSSVEIDQVSKLKRHGTRFVYDLDDDLINISSSHEEASFFKQKKEGIIGAMQIADLVTVSTLELSKTMLDSQLVSPSNLKVVKNELSSSWVEEYSFPDFKRNENYLAVYMGSPSHKRDWLLVEESLHRWLSSRANFRLVVIGIPLEDIRPHDRISHMPTPFAAQVSYPAFVSWYRSLPKFHIGIHPMENNQINNSKSSIKILQYASQGTLAVTSENTEILELSRTFNFGEISKNLDHWESSLELVAERALEGGDSHSLTQRIKVDHILSSKKGSALLLKQEMENLV